MDFPLCNSIIQAFQDEFSCSCNQNYFMKTVCSSLNTVHGAVSKIYKFSTSHSSLLFQGPDITYMLMNVKTDLLKPVFFPGAHSVHTWYF